MPALERKIAAALPDVIRLRHHLHANPEIAFEERETAGRIIEELSALSGIEIETGVGGTGVVAVLGRERPGPCVGLRADMDCLPIREETGLDYASTKPGLMHACGHDGHVSALVGAARVLAELVGQLDGPVKFIFQPAEEGRGGARRVIEDGALENPKVDAIFGFHNWPASDLPFGHLGFRAGGFMGGSADFRIEIIGRGGHAALPQLAIDPIKIGSGIVSAVPEFVERQKRNGEALVVTVTHFEAGNTVNIIPDTAFLEGTIRSLSPDLIKRVPEKFAEFVANKASENGAFAKVDLVPGYPVTTNDRKCTEFVAAIATELYGAERVRPDYPAVLAAEDFSYYQQLRPGCFYFLGVRPPDKETIPPLHHPKFDFNDDILPQAIRMHCEIALRFARSWQS